MGWRKVRTPQGSIVGNAHRLLWKVGPVQQKGCTDNAVVKSGKLYGVQCHVYRLLRIARSMPEGRQLKAFGNKSFR